MSDVSQTAALAAILDALTLMQDQVEEIGERSKRLEANQADILARLETIDAAQAIATDLQPNLEHLASEVSETRGEMGEGFARVAQVAGWAHAAAAGNAAPLPADVLDDPLLELFVISQPADRTSTRRAIVDWREKARTVDTAALNDPQAIAGHRGIEPDHRHGRWRDPCACRELLLGIVSNLLAIGRIHATPKDNEIVLWQHFNLLGKHQRAALIGQRRGATPASPGPYRARS